MTRDTSISAREREVAALYAGGATYHIIATQLFIAPATVRSHLAAIYRKLKVSSKLELKARLDGDIDHAKSQIDQAAVISELALRLEEGVSRENALRSVLRIISSSNGDLNAVIPSILRYALELCDADAGLLHEYRQNSRFCPLFTEGLSQKTQDRLVKGGEFTADPKTPLGRVVAHREVVNVVDRKSAEPSSHGPFRIAASDFDAVRSMVAIPMLAGDELLGAFVMVRHQVRPFAGDVTRLASIFAEQSIVAIKNAQLISALRNVIQPVGVDEVLA